MTIHITPTAPTPAAATTTVAIVIMRARKVSERVVEKHEPINEKMPIRTRWRRAIRRGRGFDQDREPCEWTSSAVWLGENSTSTADTAAGLAASAGGGTNTSASLHLAWGTGGSVRAKVIASVACIQSGGESTGGLNTGFTGEADWSTVDFHCRLSSGWGSDGDSSATGSSAAGAASSDSFSHRFFFLEGR